MSSAPESITPAPMEGHGHYNGSSRVQAARSVPAVPLLVRAAQSVALPPAPLPIVTADYGASEGHNSLASVATAIAVVRPRVGPARAHEDAPAPAFFDRLEGAVAARVAMGPEWMNMPLAQMLLVARMLLAKAA